MMHDGLEPELEPGERIFIPPVVSRRTLDLAFDALHTDFRSMVESGLCDGDWRYMEELAGGLAELQEAIDVYEDAP